MVFSAKRRPSGSEPSEGEDTSSGSDSGSVPAPNSGSTPDPGSKPPKNKKQRGPDKKPRKSGKEHGNYVHGRGKTRDYNSKLYSAWGQGVLQKDDFRCFITGETDSAKLECHHLNGWDAFEDQRYSIANEITILREIHTKFHQKFGFGNNTMEQFELFIKDEYNITEYPWRDADHEPSLTTDQMLEKQKSMEEKSKEGLLALIASRNYQLVDSSEGFFSYSMITVYCPTHSKQHQTKVTNYKKSKTGMLCCGKVLQDEKRVWDHLSSAKELRRKEKEEGEV